MKKEKSHDDVVHGEQQRGAEDSTRDRVVVADDRVLQRVREHEEHDEVERIELPELALPGDAQSYQKKDVDDERADDFGDEWLAGYEHFRPDRMHVGAGSRVAGKRQR